MKTFTKFLMVWLLCSPAFFASAQTPCGSYAQAGYLINPNHVYQFIDSSLFANGWLPTAHYWSFGDGSTSTLQDPTHVYSSPGIYTVCLYETAQLQGTTTTCTDTSCITVDYCGGMVLSNFTYSVHGDTVLMVGTASGNYPPFSFSWNFGDGSPGSSGATQVHVFPGQGTYHVCMEAHDANGCTGTFCQDITIINTACVGVHPSFTYQTSLSTIVLTSTSTGIHTSTQYQWFMDGNPISNITPNTSFTYNNIAPGTHQFCLKLFSSNSTPPYLCADTCMYVTIPGTTPPCGTAGLNYYTTNTGSIHAYSTSTGVDSTTLYTWYIWGTNGNLIQTQSGHNNYIASQNLPNGTYQVCLYLFGANQILCDSACLNAVVNSCPITPAWAYALHTNDTVVFELVDTNSSANHYLSFGDGTSGSGTHQTHIYANPGTYTVCSYVYIPNTNCVDSFCQTITVGNSSPCNLSAGFQFTLSGNTVAFSGNANPTGALYHWNFGDNTDTTSNSHYVTHQYPADTVTQVYYACLIVTIPGSICSDTFCQYVTVPPVGNNTGCHAQFAWSFVPSNYLTIYFTNQSNTANTNATYLWSFGDGSTSSNFDPHHTYASPGAYAVCLTVSTANGCSSTYCDTVVVGTNTGGGCHANFSWNFATNLTGGIVFNNLSTTSSNTAFWHWSFGDGDSSTAFAPVHQYSSPGIYYVCLTVTNANGCSDTYCDSINVGQNTGSCHAQFTWNTINSLCGTVQFHNTSTGNYTGVYWSFGDGVSSQQLNPDHHYASPGTYTVVLTVFGGSCQMSFTQVITIAPCSGINDTICGIVFNDLNSNGILDSNETVIAGAEVHIGNHAVLTDSNGHYVYVTTAGNYSVYVNGQQGCIATVPLNPNSNVVLGSASYYVQGVNGGTFCGYNFGFNCNIVHVCGVVYYDANGNGVQDSTETGIPNVHVFITGTNGNIHNTYTNANGEYCETLPAGTYTVHIAATNYQTCTITPTSITVNATSSGIYYSGNNFGLQCPPGNCDLMVEVVPHTTVTAGFPAWYSIQVCNVGTSVSGGTVNMFFPADIYFNNATPVPTSVNTSTHTITWNQGSLLPGQCAYYWVTFNADPFIGVGTPAFTLVNVTPDANCNDVNLVNNVDTIHQAFTASWDPNNKLAYVTNYDDPQYQVVSSMEPNQRIEYVINFQNEGTAAAVNVIVNDQISGDLDMNSFEMLGSSHPCMVTTNGSTVNFKFSDIMLPYAAADEPGSHGWVRFAIHSVNGLPAGHVISDDAAIYFDYNSPVITNDAAVIMLEPNGINDMPVNTTVVIAPNPMNAYTRITLDSKDEGFRFRVTDMTGRVVADRSADTNTLLFDRNSLASGIYLYQVVQHNKPVAQGKLVVE